MTDEKQKLVITHQNFGESHSTEIDLQYMDTESLYKYIWSFLEWRDIASRGDLPENIAFDNLEMFYDEGLNEMVVRHVNEYKKFTYIPIKEIRELIKKYEETEE